MAQRHELTPGAQRAFEFAAQWQLGNDGGPLLPQQLLCGLLAEPECRAAMILAMHQIDLGAIQTRWPDLTRRPDDDASGTANNRVQLSATIREA